MQLNIYYGAKPVNVLQRTILPLKNSVILKAEFTRGSGVEAGGISVTIVTTCQW